MSDLDSFYGDADLSAISGVPLQAPAPPGHSYVPALLRGGLRGVLPSAGGFAGFSAGAATGAALGAPLDPFTFGGASVVLGGGLGLAGAFGGSYATERAQARVADAVTDGDYSRSAIQDATEHPTASLIGGAVPQLLFMRPSNKLALLPRALGATLGGGLEAGTEYARTGHVDPLNVALQAGFGAALDHNTSLGDAIGKGIAPLVGSITRGPSATLERMAAEATHRRALSEIPDADAHIQAAAAMALDPNISPETRAALIRSRALQAALGDRQTPDEIAASHVIEADAQTEASNPHVATPDTATAHGEALAKAIRSLDEGTPAPELDPRAAVRDWQMPDIGRDNWHWAIRQQESGGNAFAVSAKGAKGAMQVLDSTMADPGYGVAPAKDSSLKERDRVGSDLLDAYNRHFGNELLATAAYNAGPGRLEGWTDKAGRHHAGWLQTIGDPRKGEIGYAEFAERIPIKETRDYVHEVFRRMAKAPPRTPLLRPELFAEGGPLSMPELEGFAPIAGESWEDALARMQVTESGGAAGALWHPEIGDIDVPWGKPGTGESDGFGLAKLERFHPEVLHDLPARVAAMDVVSQTPNRIRLASADGQAAVSLNWQGDPTKPWLLTSYERKAPASTVDERAGAGGQDVSPGLGADATVAENGAQSQPAAAERPAPAPRPRRPRGPRSAPRSAEPVDALSFLADRGGLRDDEGHDLQGRGRLISGIISGRRRRGGSAGIGLPQFAPMGGHLFRKGGLSIDEAGELLHEAGFFTGDRPTTADVLDLLAASNTKPVHRPEDVVAAREAEMLARYGEEPHVVPEFDGPGQHAQGALHFDEPAGAGARAQAESLEHDLRVELFHGTKAPQFDAFDPAKTREGAIWFGPDAEHVKSYAEGGRTIRAELRSRKTLEATDQITDWVKSKQYHRDMPWAQDPELIANRDAGRMRISDLNASFFRWVKAEGYDAVHFPQDARWAVVDPTAIEIVSHGTGDEEIMAVDRAPSLDRGAETNPAIADRQRQQAELGAAAPMRAAAEQDGTLGLGLFDQADQPEFRLDPEGGAQSIRQILDDVDREEQAAATLRGCLVPPKGNA
ncbi:transglycosylase SLT domain-containing protein [Sphingomonas oligoaromativorans]|uniref:transglycosylase SLT domain-containing protein n=1 Tax=Sphingomonas oligoaromativorans TaxID=575322 RepID=UPI0014204C21|nr:transglycosylase SLT domain-containing protein [Sphingomonas oligoaromativorans]NIJ34341.1 hypothetical protein [Sphingomonas oligoaromativorans]